MDIDYISRAKIQEVEREIAQIQLASAAKRATSRRRAAVRPEQRTVPAMPLRLLRRAWRQAGTLRPAAEREEIR
ncbi:MAG: hypothetical protein ACE1ZT_00875 [Dehalococcoidia bacterium]